MLSTETVKCPHCKCASRSSTYQNNIGTDKDSRWLIVNFECHNCHKMVIDMVEILKTETDPEAEGTDENPNFFVKRIHPTESARDEPPTELPEYLSQSFREACAVLTVSPMASAALSRRCLQGFIRDVIGITKRDLNQEIDTVIDRENLPTDLAEDIDAIRQVGNFAAHSIKFKNTGEIVEVESGEAEWLLNVLEELFEHYYVRRKRRETRRASVNAKLIAAGKQALKSVSGSGG